MTDIPDRYIDLSLKLTGTEGWTWAVVRYAAEAENQHGLHDEARAILAHAKTLMERDAERQEVSDAVEDWTFDQTAENADLLKRFILPKPVDPDEELAREVAEKLWGVDHTDTGFIDSKEAALATIKALRTAGRITDAQ